MFAERFDVRCRRTSHDRPQEEASKAFTLVFPRRGAFRYRGRSGTMIGDPHTVLLFHPQEPYEIAHPADDGDDCTALHCDAQLVADALGAAAESAASWTPDARTLRALHRALDTLRDAEDACDRDVRIADLLAMLGSVRALSLRAREARRIDTVRERIAADPGASTSLGEFARDAGFSPFHLARLFRARTGTSLHQYRVAVRLAAAQALLREGADVTSVAVQIGFSSASHFGDAFRKAFGTTPSRARRP